MRIFEKSRVRSRYRIPGKGSRIPTNLKPSLRFRPREGLRGPEFRLETKSGMLAFMENIFRKYNLKYDRKIDTAGTTKIYRRPIVHREIKRAIELSVFPKDELARNAIAQAFNKRSIQPLISSLGKERARREMFIFKNKCNAIIESSRQIHESIPLGVRNMLTGQKLAESQVLKLTASDAFNNLLTPYSGFAEIFLLQLE